jgi:uncharacterized protein YecE (DUF72 family)
VRETPDDFIFALKLSRYITHIKRLAGVKAEFRKFIRRAGALGDRLGPILIQLPPNFAIDVARIETFLTRANEVGRRSCRTRRAHIGRPGERTGSSVNVAL